MKRRVVSFLIILALCLNLCPAWALAAEGLETERKTLQKDQSSTTPELIDTALELNLNGYTLTGTSTDAIQVTGTGSLTLNGGDSSKVFSQRGAGVKVESGGILHVTEAAVEVRGETYGLHVANGARKVQLSGGTYSGRQGAIYVEDRNYAALLAEGCTFFDEIGNALSPDNVATAYTLIVGQCENHSKTYTHDAGTPTHTWTCAYCGATGTEKCTFDFTQDGDGTSACGSCGNKLAIVVSETDLSGLVYDGTVKPQDVEVTVTLTDPDGNNATTLTRDTDFSVDIEKLTNAGQAKVTVTGITFNGTFVKTYTVEQATPAISWSDTSKSVDYDGQPVEAGDLPAVNKQNIVSGDEDSLTLKYQYTTDGTNFTDGLPTDAGTYQVKASLEGNPNYTEVETETLLTLTISPINPIVTAPEATTPIYNRSPQALVTAGTLSPVAIADGLKIQFATSENGTYSADIPTETDAGDYTVWYQVTGLTDNYIAPDPNPAEVTGVKIQRKAITPVVTLSQYKYLYDGGYHEPTVTVKDDDRVTDLPDTEYKVEYVNNRNVSTDAAPAKVVVSDKIENGGNYDITQVEVEFKITHRTQDTLSITNKPATFTYGDKFTLGTSGGSGNGDVTWAITSGTDVATVDANSGQVTITGHGSVTVKATKSGKDPASNVVNYEDATAVWTFTAVQKPVTATVTAEDKTYDGDADATVQATVEQGVLAGDEITITGLTGTFDDANAGADKTVTVDSTSATITGTNSEHYAVTYSATTVKATIHKAVAKITTAPVAASLTYNGTAQALIATGAVVDPNSVAVEYSLSETGPYSTDFPKGTDAGTYTVWYRVQETPNYTGLAPASVDVTIAKKPVSPTITLDQDMFVYDGTEKKPVVTLKESNDAAAATIPASEYMVAYSGNINVGTATVTVTAKADGNYTFENAPVTANFTINKEQAKVLTAPEAAGRPLTFNTFAQRLVTAGVAEGGTMVYRVGETGNFESGIPEETNAGTYKVYYKVQGDGNHSDSEEKSLTVTIAPKTVKDPTIELFDGTNPLVSYIYDGTAKTPTVVVKDGSDIIDAGEYEIVYSDNTDAGKATVNITDKPNGNYTVTGSATFVINKADIEFNPAPSAATLTYNGTAQELLNAGTTTGGTVLYALNSSTSTYGDAIPTGTNAGTYNVYYKVVGDKNHNDFPATPVAVTIEKATAAINPAPAAIASLTYTGQPQALVTAGATNVGFLVYSLDGTDFSREIPTGTNAGTYTVYYKVDETSNYTGVPANTTPISVTIGPKNITPKIELSETSYQYDGTKKAPKVTLKDGDTVIPASQYTVTWAGTKGQTDADLLRIADTYTATITSVANGNYTFNVTAAVEITPAEQAALHITGQPEHVYYGDTITTLGTTGGTGEGSVKWSVTSSGNNATIEESTGKLTITGTGAVTVRAERSVPNYGAVGDNWNFTVEPKPVTAEVTVAAKDYDGNKTATVASVTVPTINGDTVTIAPASITATFDDPNAGTGKTVTLDSTNATADNTDKYAVSYPATARGNITPKTLSSVTVVLSDHDLKTDASVTPNVYYYEYDGTAKEPKVTVKYTEDSTDKVVPASNYDVAYANNKNVSTSTVKAAVTVTAKAGGNYTFTDATADFEIRSAAAVLTSSPQAKDLTYEKGTQQELVTVGTATGGHIEYSLDGGTNYGTDIPKGENAGTYTVTYKVVSDANHKDTPPAQVSVTIKPKEITPAITLSGDGLTETNGVYSYTYDGTVKTPTVTVKDGTETILATEYSVSYRDNVNAGTATVTVSNTNGGNYIVNGTASFTITKKAPTVTAPTGKTGLYYTGEVQELVNAGVTGHGTVVYSVNGGNYSAAIPTASAVGTYNISWKVLGDGNHSDTTPATLSVEIAKNTVTNPTITLSQDQFTYDGNQHRPSVTVYDNHSRLIPEHEYTVSIAGTNGNVGMVNVDTYTVTVTTPDTSNYVINSNNTRTFQIVPADQETISITGTQSRVRYGDTIQLGVTGGTGSGTVTWKVEGATDTTLTQNGLLTVKDVGGPYTVTVTRSRGGNYTDVSATWEFTAGKKPVTAEVTVAAKDWDGTTNVADTAIAATVKAADLAFTGDSITITGLTGAYDSANAGAGKTVTLTGGTVGGTNADKYDVTIPATATASILAVAATVDTAPEAVASLTYDASQSQALVTAGTANGGTMVYSLDGKEFTPSVPKGKDAGTYKVWYKVQGDQNHTDSAVGTVDVTIARQTVTPQIELSPPSGQYDGKVQQPAVTVRDTVNNVIPASEYKVTYVSDNGENWTDKGTYTVKVENINGGNYIITEAEAEFKISTSAQAPLEIVNKPGLVYYGDTFTLSATGGSGSEAVTWSSSDTSIADVDANGFVTIKGTGSATITATKAGGGNYDEAKATYPLNALKKQITAIVTADDRVYVSGDTSATIHVIWKDGDLINGDTIQFSPAPTGTFDSDAVGTNKQVTVTATVVNNATAQKYDITIPATTTASILKAPATAPTVTAVENLTYTGSAQALVTGDANARYSGTRDGVYTATVPTGTNAGTYTVWYKAKGDDNHSESAPQAVEVTISPKTLTADASNVELSGNDLKTETKDSVTVYYYEYDGTEKTPTVVIKDGSAMVASGEYTVTYGDNKNVTTADKKATVTITDNEGGNYTVSGSVTFEIRKGGAQLVTSPQAVRGLTYTGAAQELVSVGTASGGHLEYKLTSVPTGETTSTSFSATIPAGTNAGTYTVAYMVVGDDNHEDAAETGSVTVTISPKTVVSPKITVTGGPFTYTSNAHEPTVTVVDGSTTIPATEYTLSYRDNVNAGTATVIVADNNGGNYTVNGTATFEIGKAAATIGTAPTGKTGLHYNGTVQELLDTLGTATGGTLVYSLSETGEYSAAIPTGKAVGEYEIWYKVQGDANHSDSTAAALSPKVKIDKNTVTNPTINVEPASVKFTGEKQTPTITVKDDNGLLIDGSEYTVTYADTANSDNSDLTQVGTYTVTVTGVANGNYTFDATDGKNTAEFKITPADQTALTITGTRERVYYGDTIQLSTTGGIDGGTVTWKVSNESIASITNGLLTIKGVGSVTVTATSTKTGYTDQSATWNLYADKKPVTALVTAASKTYDGDADADVTATLQGSDFVGTDSFTITLTGCTFEDPNAWTDKKVNVVSTSPTFTPNTGNHENYAITYPATATASIFKANIVDDDVTAPTAVADLEYTGLPQELIETAGTATGGTMEYSTDGTNYSASLPTGTDAGGYDVWYRVKGDGNHNDVAGVKLANKVTIAKQTVDADKLTIEFNPNGATYDGQEHKPTVTVKDASGRVIPDSEYTVSYGTTNWKDVGDHTVTITGKTDGNYNITGDETARSAKFTILPAGQSPLSIVGQPGEVRYGDVFTLSANGGSGTGAVTWESSDSTVAFVNSQTGRVEIKKAGGPVTITARKASGGGYAETTATWTFSAEKRPATAIVTARNKPYDGGTTATLDISWKDGDLLGNDSITLNLTGAFEDANVGENKIVRITRSGDLPDGGGKYAVTYNSTTTAAITATAATVSGVQSGPWTYTGSEQPLLTGGSATNGDIVYSRNGVDFMKTSPTETNAGRYTVYYKARGNTNYADSDVRMVEVTIQPKAVTGPTIELSSDSFEYDGTAKKPDVVSVKDVSNVIPAGEYTVSYSNNVNVGTTAKVTITDVSGGNYTVSGSKTFTITAGAASLKDAPKANNLTYNGFEQELVTEGTAVNGQVVYAESKAGSYSTSIPMKADAGTYQVWYKVQGANGAADTTPKQLVVTIRQKEVTPVIRIGGRSSYSVAYNGSAQEPDITVYVESKLYDNTKYLVDYSNNTNVGTAEITVQSAEGGNYQFLAFKTFEITKGKAEFSTPPTAKPNLVYNGTVQPLVVAGIAKNSGIVLYSLDGSAYSTAIPTAINRGTYTVFAKVQGSSNYEESDVVQVPVTIGVNALSADDLTVTLPTTSFSYTGGEVKPTITVTDRDGNVIDSSEYTVTYSDNVNVGTAKVSIKSKTNGNYSFTASTTFAIVDASQTPLAITGKPDGTVYYGDTFSLGTTGGGSGAVAWSSSDTDVADIGQTTGVVSIKKSGSVTITATKGGSTDTWTFYAQPRPVTATVTAANKVYDGNNTATLTVTLSGLVGTDTFTATAEGQFADENAGTNKNVLITGLNISDEVRAKYDISYNTTTTASITPAPAAVTAAPTLAGSLTYNGGAQALLASDGTADSGNLMYSLDGRDYSYTIPTGTDAKTYTVWYKVEASDENHKDSAAVKLGSVTISANQDTPSVLCTPATVQYDGTEKTPTVVVRDSANRIIPESEYTVTFGPSPIIAVGKYAVTVTDKRPGAGNYEFSSVTVADAFEIVASSQNPLSIVTDIPTDVHYGDTFRLSAMGGSGSGAIQWSIAESSVATINDNGVVTVKGTGNFTVTAYREAWGGYSQSNTDSVPFVAQPKPVTPVVTVKPKNYDGTTSIASDAITATVRSGDLVSGDSITINGLAAVYDSANAGTGKTVALNWSSVAVSGTNTNRYIITWPDYVTATINRVDAKISAVPAAVANLVANGSAQQLVSAGTTANNIGTVVYSMSQYGAYSTTIPTGTDAGKYTVWYKVADSVNYNGVAPAYVDVEIAAAPGGGTNDAGSENNDTGTGGTTTKTTTRPDGSTTVVKTEADGTVTTTETDAAGNKTETVKKADGSSVTTAAQKDGTTATVNTSAEGKVEAEVTLPKTVVAAARAEAKPITLPIPEVEAAANTEDAPVVTVNTGSTEPVKVLIPTTEAKPGTVAVIVNADGTEEVVKSSVSTADGLAVTLPDRATVKLVDNSKTFHDVQSQDWAADAVAFTSARELFTGTSEDTFSPDVSMTRAMMVTVLARLDGVDTTGGSTWYEKGAQWAQEKGISTGSNLGSNITREQLAVMFWRYAGAPASSGSLDDFSDAGSVSGYAQEALRWAVETGLLAGNGTALLPQGEATRAEVAQMLKRFMENA